MSDHRNSHIVDMLNRAMSAYQTGNLESAEFLYKLILSSDKKQFDAWHMLGVIHGRRGFFEESDRLIKKALAIKPNHAEAHYNRALALHELKRLEEAVTNYEKALKYQPNHIAAYYNYSLALQELKRFADALASLDKVIALDPNFAEAHSNRGLALQELKRHQEALASYDKALSIKPNLATAYYNRGVTLQSLGRLEDAIASYDKAIAIKFDYAECHSNRGLALQEIGRLDEALATYDRAIKFNPDLANAHWNEALLCLLIGDFQRGWEKYEWRWKEEQKKYKRHFSQPLWLGTQDLEDKTILLHTEQGFGDTIQFCRYAELVALKGARIILEVDKTLVPLMHSLKNVHKVVTANDQFLDFDYHCPLLSLPLAFGTRLETIPAKIPYLSTSNAHIHKWTQRLTVSTAPRIAINWAGNANLRSDIRRSIGLSRLLPLLSNENVQFFSIQKDLRDGDLDILKTNPQITHLGNDIETFADTAAVISLMDLVISSDTSVVHLAGALGKPVWILLQYIPDWRWLLDRDDNPWYPTARLFRQPRFDDWDSVIQNVGNALCAFTERQKT